jgi:hypothetical protein
VDFNRVDDDSVCGLDKDSSQLIRELVIETIYQSCRYADEYL